MAELLEDANKAVADVKAADKFLKEDQQHGEPPLLLHWERITVFHLYFTDYVKHRYDYCVTDRVYLEFYRDPDRKVNIQRGHVYFHSDMM